MTDKAKPGGAKPAEVKSGGAKSGVTPTDDGTTAGTTTVGGMADETAMDDTSMDDATSWHGDPAAEARTQPFDRRMLEFLVCPQTHAVLSYDAERLELVSRAAHLAYPIRGGIPVMLASEARQID